METNKVKYAVLDLEFLSHSDNGVVTAIGVATTTLSKQGNRVKDKEHIYGGRVPRSGIEIQRDFGSDIDKEVAEWAEANNMDKVLSELDEVKLGELVGEVAKILNEADYIMERSVGADVPKFKHLCELLRIDVDIPYWKVMEVRSYLAGAGVPFLNKVWNDGLTKHNPISDALMDVMRIEYASEIRNMTVAGRNMVQYVMAGGGSTKYLDEALEMYKKEQETKE